MAVCMTGGCERASRPVGVPHASEATHEDRDTSELAQPDEHVSASEKVPAGKRPSAVVEALVWPKGDRGVFSRLDDEVTWHAPVWLQDEATLTLCLESKPDAPCYAYIDKTVVGMGSRDGASPVVEVTSWEGLDVDEDGIPDHADVWLGAIKTELNGAKYLGGYEQLDYPGGDVSQDKGVCTDVVIRAVRNAGIDLQVELFEDIKRSKRSFPMVKKANPHIDQRRVKTLLPYFKRQWRALDPSPRSTNEPYLPGDVLFMQTMGDSRPDHIGIVSGRQGATGLPLVINNWTDGFHTSAMDILEFAPVTHRFRLTRPQPSVAKAHRGLEGVALRQGITLPDEVERVVLVTGSFWSTTHGMLRRYERTHDGWAQRGDAIKVRLGAQGMATGRGAQDVKSTWARRGGTKREGDRKSPTGVFELGTAFGPATSAPGGSVWSWHEVTRGDVWVDDAKHQAYNRMMSKDAPVTWSSSEDLQMYELGLVIKHNTDPVEPGAGSAIFMHTWGKEPGPTLGCTSMSRADLERLIGWLDPAKPTRFVHVVDEVF